jgi:hypothetical protein
MVRALRLVRPSRKIVASLDSDNKKKCQITSVETRNWDKTFYDPVVYVYILYIHVYTPVNLCVYTGLYTGLQVYICIYIAVLGSKQR